ncbi:carbohydrate ABC transporter permease [Microbacterium sp.]|uniref:carbohydrate ABC transporter permease n=1 Tax=Microbacterium sp. TaxID=51671 RepID=UPI002810D8A6|nr:carbohydrate ABC transporter permease [Microbacterium sp.]
MTVNTAAHTMSNAVRIGIWTVIAFSVAAVILPLAWVVRLAFRPLDAYTGDPTGLDGGVTLENIQGAWDAGIGSGLLTSALIVPLGALIATVLATVTGYALAKEDVPFRRGVTGLIVATIAVPLTSLAVPVFDQALQFGYLGSRPALAVVYGVLFTGWGVLFMSSYFSALPDELLEAARCDGAGRVRTMVEVAFPISIPAMISIFVVNMFSMWSELIIGLVLLPTTSQQTAAVVLAQFATQYRSGGPVTAAAMLIMILPMVVAFFVCQRWLKAEILGGAVKG